MEIDVFQKKPLSVARFVMVAARKIVKLPEKRPFSALLRQDSAFPAVLAVLFVTALRR